MRSIKNNSLKYLPIMAGMTLALAVSFSGTPRPVDAGVETAIGSDVKSKELRAITIESWDRDYTKLGYGWEVLTNKDNTYPGAQYNHDYAGPQVERAIKLIKGSPGDIKENLNFDKAYILGIKFAFTFPGNNVVTVRPPRQTDHYMVERPRPYLNELALAGTAKNRSCYKNAKFSRNRKGARPQVVDCVNGIEMPGNVKAISVWINGRGNEYDLEAWLEDWRGDTHILKFGSVDFVGWRPLMVFIPKQIPQEVASYPQIKTLVFRQFKIRNRPNTSLEPVYLFFDELRILTDVFEVHFDGAQISFDEDDCTQKQRLYDVIRKNTRFKEFWPKPVDCSKAPGPAQNIPEITPNDDGS